MENSRLKPGPHKLHFDYFPNSQKEAKEQGRTYYLDAAHRCIECGSIARWASNKYCMGCTPTDIGEKK